VIRLVQHAARGEFHSVNFKEIAINILRANDGTQFALDRDEDSGERQAALFTILLALDAQDFRVNHGDALCWVFAAGTIHHEEPL
jgi:hypothetical protein